VKIVSALFAAACAVCAAAEDTVLENDALRLEFAGADGGYSLKCVVNKLAGGTRFCVAASNAPLWELAFWRDGDADVPSRARITNLSPCRAKRVERRAGGGAVFVWEGFDLPGEKNVACVRATVRLAADGASLWSIEAPCSSAVYGLAETRYPILRRVAQSGEADVLMPRTDLGASLVKKMPWLPRPRGFAALGYWPMMTAFIRDGAGLYFAAHDSSARIKTIKIMPEHGVEFYTPVENAGIPGRAAEGPRYETTLAAFKGDWWEAARLYRVWALTTKWTSKGRIVDRSDYPRRIAEIPFWINTHAMPDEASNTLARARAVFPDFDTGLHWHLWQHSGHDVNYPEYFPAQPGTKECIAFCRSIGQEAMPYTNGRLWSTNLLSFALARPYSITMPDGSPRVERYGKLTPPLSPICPSTEMWNETLNGFAGRVLDLGAGSLFLDQIGACPALPCYSRAHPHPVGGGAWYFEAYQRILSKTHARYAAKGAFLTTEGSGEPWMNVVDGYLTVQQRQPNDVPFYHAVYSGYTTYFCTPENHEDDDGSFFAAQARETLWGQALGWYHPLILEWPSKCAIIRQLASFRQAHLDCLAYGSLLGEVSFDGEVPDVPLTWLGRKQFYMWKVKNAPLSPTITGSMPSLLGYVWRSASTGREIAFLANLSDVPRDVSFRWRDAAGSAKLAARGLAAVELR
jgi:hypothetical protein